MSNGDGDPNVHVSQIGFWVLGLVSNWFIAAGTHQTALYGNSWNRKDFYVTVFVYTAVQVRVMCIGMSSFLYF